MNCKKVWPLHGVGLLRPWAVLLRTPTACGKFGSESVIVPVNLREVFRQRARLGAGYRALMAVSCRFNAAAYLLVPIFSSCCGLLRLTRLSDPQSVSLCGSRLATVRDSHYLFTTSPIAPRHQSYKTAEFRPRQKMLSS